MKALAYYKKKYVQIAGDKKELLQGSFSTVVIKVVGLVIGYAFIMFLSRNYGAETVGVYQIFVQSLGIVGLFILFGFNQSIVRFASEFSVRQEIGELKKVLIFFSAIIMIGAMFSSAVMYFGAEALALLFLKDGELKYVFEALAITVPFFALNMLFIEAIRGLKKIKISETLRLFSIKFFTVLVFTSIVIFIPFSLLLPIFSYGVATIVTVAFSAYFLVKLLKHENSKSRKDKHFDKKKYVSVSFTMYQSIIIMVASNQALVFILAYYSNPANVGVYNVAFQLAALSSFIYGAVITVSAPKYSELFHSGCKQTLQQNVRFSSKVIFWATGSVSLFLIIASEWLMAMFGDEFTAGSHILIVLSLGNFINAFTGPGGVFLDMIDKQAARRNIVFLSMFIVIPLSFLLVPMYGGIGLASALLISKIIVNFVTVYYVKKRLGLSLVYIPFWPKARFGDDPPSSL